MNGSMVVRVLGVAALVGFALMQGDLARAEEPTVPRYRLVPGQEITYHTVTHSERDRGVTTYTVDWKIWTLAQDADGAYPLVIRCDLATQDPGATSPQSAEEVDTIVWKCRLFADGRLVGATTRGTVRDPFRLFPRLPDSLAALASGWDGTGPDAEQVRIHYQATLPPEPGAATLKLTATSTSPEDRVYVLEHATVATFDPARGFVTRVETRDTAGYGIKGKTQGVIELVGVEQKSAKWQATFHRDADAYFAAVAAHEAAEQQAGCDAERCTTLLTTAKATLQTARDGLTTSFLREALDKMIANHDRSVSYQVEAAQRRARLVGQPAANWEATDMDGKVHRLADYRGRVVVMDFWYRGCGWCMTAMPQVNRLAAAFQGQPVTVLGMSTDRDEKDARVVIDAMKLNYPTIRAESLPEQFAVQVYPTLIVVDPLGKIREVHEGYSPHLFDELSSLIRELLPAKAAE